MSLQGNVFKLANGTTIPAVAYGAGTKWFKFGNPEVSEPLIQSLKFAVNNGFTHVDGAMIYGTDREVGAALSTVDKSKIFHTNKYMGNFGTNKVPYENPLVSLRSQLKDLKMDQVDLYLLHHPFFTKEINGYDLKDAWKFMEQIVDEGLAKSIGLSNFAVEDVKTVLESARIKPVVNQIEFNAYLQNQTPGIVKFCQDNDILVSAYCPLAPILLEECGELNEYLDKLAEKNSKTPGQVLLRWILQRGVLPVTTSSNEERIAQLNNLFDFELTAEEVQQITDLGNKHPTVRKYWNEEYDQYN